MRPGEREGLSLGLYLSGGRKEDLHLCDNDKVGVA